MSKSSTHKPANFEQKIIEIPVSSGIYLIERAKLGRIHGSAVVRVLAEVPATDTLLPMEEGNILLWRKSDGIYIKYDRLDDALRACFSMIVGYGVEDSGATGSELTRLEEFVAESMELCYLLLDWKTMTPRQRREYELRCVELAESLGNVRDEHKVLAREMAKQAQTVIDCRGRENIGKTRAQVSGSAFRGESRIDNISWLHKFIDRRKASLMLARRENLRILARAMQDLLRMKEILESNNPNSREFVGLGNALISELGKTHDLPWRHSFRKTAVDIENALKALGANNQEDARRLVRYSLASLSGLEYYTRISNYQLRLSVAVERNPRVSEEIHDLHKELKQIIDEMDPSEIEYDTKVNKRTRIGLEATNAIWNMGRPFSEVRAGLRKSTLHI